MYLVTGGAGFIGSNIVAELSDAGEEVIVCDSLQSDDRWKNLANHEIAAIVSPSELKPWLEREGESLTAVVHMGAISTTTETNIELIVDSNIRATLDLLDWCTKTQTRLIYASSAATYGDGTAGFDDEFTPEALGKLRPLNAYGWSKHLVDRRISRLKRLERPLPPQFVGLKFFNVFGPNEYHKGSMQSVIAQNFANIMTGQPIRLFRSKRSDYKDGGQCRDFIYVKDCSKVVKWFLENRDVSGLFNVGSGKARSWLDLAQALFAAVGKVPAIEFIDMPHILAKKYQYFTEAKIDRLRNAGYHNAVLSLEHGVYDYVQAYLSKNMASR